MAELVADQRASGALMVLLPTFQPQNPAINGYYLGWSSCTSYSGAMAAAFHRQQPVIMSGEALRRKTGDTSGGTNLAQLDSALNSGWSINLDVTYRLPWSTFQKKIDGGAGAVLQGWYAPIADSRFDAGRGFRGNHAVFVPPTWGVMDPLADGRPGAYRYKKEPYPRTLLRTFAGRLNVASSGYRAVGDGLVYAAFTRDNTHTYALNFDGGERFWVYKVGPDGRIVSRSAHPAFSSSTSAACTPPQRRYWPGPNVYKTLAMVTAGGSSLHGDYIQVPQAAVHLEVVP